MQKLKDVMTENVETVHPEDSVLEVANRMKSLDTGAIPVCDGKKIKGMVTDRDIVIRGLAERKDLSRLSAREIMTPGVTYCYEDESVKDAIEAMKERRIRRLIVVDHNKSLVGIVSIGDLATQTGREHLAGEALKEISKRGFVRERVGLNRVLGGTLLISPAVLTGAIGVGLYFLFRRRPELRDRLMERGQELLNRKAA